MVISLLLVFIFKKNGFWLALIIIVIYFVLIIIRFWSERQDNKTLLELQDLSEREFVQLLKNYFKSKGFKLTKEKENDLILENVDEKIIVRFREYQNLINASQVRDFRHSINHSRADKGYFITTSDFTHPCQKERDNLIELVNGKNLLKMLKIKNLKGIKDG